MRPRGICRCSTEFPGRRAISAILLVAMAAAGCSSTRREVVGTAGRISPPTQPGFPDPVPAAVLKVHLRDGGLAVMESWHVAADSSGAATPVDTLVGRATRFDAARTPLGVTDVRLASTDIVLIETNHTEISLGRTLGALVLGVGVVALGFLAAIAIACSADPKCFGSCPTFYVSDGTRASLMAEGFSASIAPSLEATDVDALWRALPRGRSVEIVMRNEALETHVVRSLRLLVAPRRHGRVMQTTGGEFYRVTGLQPPHRAVAAEGDVAALLADVDGEERTNAADSTDLGARERIVFDFDGAHGPGLGLAVTHRQSLIMTYLLYQTLAWMGGSAGEHLARLERGDPRWLEMAQGAGKALGPIEVQVRDPGAEWRTVGTVDETGPIASDAHLVLLPDLAPGSEIALRLARGHWRLDAVALARIGERVQPLALDPVVAVRDSLRGEIVDRAALGGAPLVTMPGQSVIYRFDLPGPAETYELFLESRGYYLEWVREPWLAQEDPAQLIGLMTDPRGALRRLAPAFKRQEAELERAFWGSRAAHP